MTEQLTIPLNKLRPSKSNMRKTDRLADIDQLAASIEANGLLENLVVFPVGGETDKGVYEVAAGGRRLEALKRLAKAKKIERNCPVACLVVSDASALTEVSLAENFERVPPHPADQFEAFAKLVGDGQTPAEVAARFGLNEKFVEQRLKLAGVSPKLIAQYRKGAMTLEQLMAFTISNDHALQNQLWFESPYEDMPAHFIRRQLTSTQVDAGDRRAVFVGAEAYGAAGGVIVRDLFDEEHEGYYQDSQLLDRLVAEKLDGIAETLRTQGWGWVEVLPKEDFSYLQKFGRIGPTEVALKPEEEETLDKLGERYDELVSLIEENGDSAANEELDKVETDINALNAKKEVWPDEDKSRSGICLSLDHEGKASLSVGLIRLELSKTDASQESSSRPKEKSGYSDAVLMDLSAHRTAALRAVLADQPDNAFITLLYALVCQIFLGRRLEYVEVGIRDVPLDRASDTVKGSKAANLLSERHAHWAARVSTMDNIWHWLQSLTDVERRALLAYCVAVSINVLGKHSNAALAYDDDADLEELVGLDMTHWWKPTEAFLVRLPKADIMEAVSEGAAPGSSRYLGDLKRSELARKAESLLGQCAWLPKPWRRSTEEKLAAE
jgi:ParB family chromosome partitioning protein